MLIKSSVNLAFRIWIIPNGEVNTPCTLSHIPVGTIKIESNIKKDNRKIEKIFAFLFTISFFLQPFL
jgi:hypothetical protein